MANNGTEDERLLRRIKNKPWVALIIVVGVVTIALASFAEAIGTLGLLDLIRDHPRISGGIGAGVLITLLALLGLSKAGLIGRVNQPHKVDKSLRKGSCIPSPYALLEQANEHSLLGRNDQAREAYGEAKTLYKAVGDRPGEANVLRGLGDLERTLGRNDQAREAYGEAKTLYKAVGDRLGEANVLYGLGLLAVQLELARQHLYQAAHLYEAIGMPEWQQQMLDEIGKLTGQ